MLGQPRHGIEIAAPHAADRDHLPQPVLSRLQQRDRAGADARPRPLARASSAGQAAPSSSRCSRCRSRSACGSTVTGRGARWRRCRSSPWRARLWIAAAADAFDLIAARAMVGVGCAASFMSVVFLCSRWFPPARLATALSAGCSPLRTSARWPPPRRSPGSRRPWAGATDSWGSRPSPCWWPWRSTPSYATGHPTSLRLRPGGKASARSCEGLLEVWTTPGLLPLLAMHFFAYATMLTVLGVWGGPYLYDVYKLDGVERGNVLLAMGVAQILGILAYGPMDRLLRSRKKVVLGGVAISVAAAGCPRPSATAGAWRGGRAAHRLLLLLRLRHGDRGARPHALPRPPGRARRHHRQHGAVPRAHRAAGPRRLYRRGVRQFRPAYRVAFGVLAAGLVLGASVYVRSRDSATASPASDRPRDRRAGRPA